MKKGLIRAPFSIAGLLSYCIGLIAVALSPLGPFVTSKETRCFSLSDLWPLPWISEKCANTSSPPSSGVMNPNPFASLNHFTVPVAMQLSSTKKHAKNERGRVPALCKRIKKWLRTRGCTRTDGALRISNTPLETTAESTIQPSLPKRKPATVAERLHLLSRLFAHADCGSPTRLAADESSHFRPLRQRAGLDRDQAYASRLEALRADALRDDSLRAHRGELERGDDLHSLVADYEVEHLPRQAPQLLLVVVARARHLDHRGQRHLGKDLVVGQAGLEQEVDQFLGRAQQPLPGGVGDGRRVGRTFSRGRRQRLRHGGGRHGGCRGCERRRARGGRRVRLEDLRESLPAGGVSSRRLPAIVPDEYAGDDHHRREEQQVPHGPGAPARRGFSPALAPGGEQGPDQGGDRAPQPPRRKCPGDQSAQTTAAKDEHGGNRRCYQDRVGAQETRDVQRTVGDSDGRAQRVEILRDRRALELRARRQALLAARDVGQNLLHGCHRGVN